jgi:hypothetical protein
LRKSFSNDRDVGVGAFGRGGADLLVWATGTGIDVEEFEESLAVSSKVPPSLVAPEPGTDAQYHCHNIHTLTLSRTLPRP